MEDLNSATYFIKNVTVIDFVYKQKFILHAQ